MGLTDAKLRALKGENRPYKIADGEGLFVLVAPKGTRLWRFSYRYIGKQKTLALGKYPQMTLLEARRARDDAKTQIAAGVDPSAVKKRVKRERFISAGNTFLAVAEEWFELNQSRWVKSYVCKPLRDHTLLQAIARVNRLFEDEDQEKQFGFIIDYEGLLGELDKALTTYSAFEGFDAEDVAGALIDIREEIKKLPQLHEQLWDLFKEVSNKKDMEQFEQFLADEAIRHDFYGRLRAFSRCLHISLSSEKVHEVFRDKKLDEFKRDWKQFTELRRSVQIRYQEMVDIKEYEPKVQKLLDDHVIALPAETIIKAVNINDPKALQAVVAESGITAASKADRIASATKRTITENMDADPAFYMRFSEMLEETIRGYRQHRMSEKDYLNSIIDIASKVGGKDRGQDVPARIKGNDDAAAFFGILEPALNGANDAGQKNQVAEIALALIDIVKAHHIVDVWLNDVAKNRMRDAIDDYFFDVVRDEKGIDLPVEKLDELESKIMSIASVRFPG